MDEMNQLVFMRELQAVTTSLQLAEAFEKNHQHILRDIDSLKDVSNFGQMFSNGNEPDSYGRNRRIYYMNRDGFILLAMSFTGKKALEFKLKYISAFNQMEKVVKEPMQLPTTPQEMLKLVLQNMGDSNEKVEALEDRIDEIEDNAPLSPGTYSFISRRIRQRVSEVARGFGRLSQKQRGQLYRDINQGVKQVSGVDTRSQLREKHYKLVMDFIQDWEPATATKTLIRQFEISAE